LKARAASAPETLLLRDEKWEYSNLGFSLLGVVLSRASGQSFADLLQSRVFGPLNLKETMLVVPAAQMSRFAQGHNADGSPTPHWNFDAAAGAGGLRMSAEDLGRYARAALAGDGAPLQAAFKLAMTRHADGPNADTAIGLAWIRSTRSGRTILNHDGGTYGFSSSLWLDPERGVAVGVLGNAFNEVNDIARHVIEPNFALTDFSITQKASVSVDPLQLARYVGTYRLSPQMTVDIRLRDKLLYAQASAQSEFALFAESPSVFFAKVTPLQIIFDDTSSDRAAGFVLHQGGQKIRAVRVP
jgi:serine-type D-Ala-D-Ala carboxypeptidase/endopeptidase